MVVPAVARHSHCPEETRLEEWSMRAPHPKLLLRPQAGRVFVVPRCPSSVLLHEVDEVAQHADAGIA